MNNALAGAGVSKLAAEQHLRAVAPGANLEFVILRVHNVYGPRMDFSPGRSSFVARAIAAVLHDPFLICQPACAA